MEAWKISTRENCMKEPDVIGGINATRIRWTCITDGRWQGVEYVVWRNPEKMKNLD